MTAWLVDGTEMAAEDGQEDVLPQALRREKIDFEGTASVSEAIVVDN